VQLTPIVYVPPGVKTVVEIVTTCEVPGATAGVILNDNGDADSPVTAGDGRLTVQVTEAAVPLVRVATTLGVVLAPAVIVALVGLHATV
jgi:hypothetical protein